MDFIYNFSHSWELLALLVALVVWRLVKLAGAVFTLGGITRIFRRAGLNPWPVAFLVVPIFGFAITGSYLAFQRWPNIAPRVVPKPPRSKPAARTA